MAETDEESGASGDADGPAPSMVVVCGLPGVGKSRVARELAESLSASVFRTDEIRTELYDDPTYDTAETERIYAEALERALAVVEDDGRAILDGTYRRESFRTDVVAGADTLGVDCGFVKVECPEGIVRERITHRTGDVSDAGLEEYYLIRDKFDPLGLTHVTVDNSGGWDRTREQIHAAFPCCEP